MLYGELLGIRGDTRRRNGIPVERETAEEVARERGSEGHARSLVGESAEPFLRYGSHTHESRFQAFL